MEILPFTWLVRAFLLTFLLVTSACVETRKADDSKPIPGSRGSSIILVPIAQKVRITGDGTGYEFASVIDILPLLDGGVWVLDAGRQPGAWYDPSIRIFDSTGKFVRVVSGVGSGPGEFLAPYGMARMKDGNVVVRDQAGTDRLIEYQPDGQLVRVVSARLVPEWPNGGVTRWLHRSLPAIRVDTANVIWMPFLGHTSTSPISSEILFLRLNSNLDVLGVTEPPDVPVLADQDVALTKRLDEGGLSVRSLFIVPSIAAGVWAWSPEAYFAVARTDAYRIVRQSFRNQLQPAALPGVDQSRLIVERKLQAVSVAPEERDSIRAQWRSIALKTSAGRGIRFPDVPKSKPLLSRIRFADDGRLLVYVSQPSRLIDGAWTEPRSIDVFEPHGEFVGRLNLPTSFELFRLNGTRMWGVSTDASGQEIPVLYSIRW